MRKVFFSFDYDDAWRVQIVRNCQKVGSYAQRYEFSAPQKWEEVKRKGDNAIKQWIDKQMYGTSVTAVLVGTKTANSRWVRYEIEKTLENKKGLLAIRIHGIKDRQGNYSSLGENPLANFPGGVNALSAFAGSKNSSLENYSGGVNVLSALTGSKNISLENYSGGVNALSALTGSKNSSLENCSGGVNALSTFAGYPTGKNYKTYDWEDDDGRENIGDWIEEAKQQSEATGW